MSLIAHEDGAFKTFCEKTSLSKLKFALTRRDVGSGRTPVKPGHGAG